jgi:hypothetical protein
MIAPLVVFAASTAPIIGIIRRWQKTNLTHATAGASHMTYRRTRIINLYWQHHASGPIKVRRSICAMVHQDQPKTHARSTSAKDAQSHCPLPRENADRPSRTVTPRPASEGLHHSGHWPRIQSMRFSFPKVRSNLTAPSPALGVHRMFSTGRLPVGASRGIIMRK